MSEKKDIARKIERLLREQHGEPLERRRADPIDVLLQTILSQNTTDVNSRRAFRLLRERFPDWEAVRIAPVGRIEESIRVGGLAATKARYIKEVLSQIHESFGELSLLPLCGMKAERAAAALARFKGVGPKTASCVLLFGCGMNVFPVDAHILRISRRLGLIPENTTLRRAHKLWAEFLPGRLAYSLHINLIRHGRQTCRARKPQCSACCLRRICKHHLAFSPDAKS